jgi:hypothetical protein
MGNSRQDVLEIVVRSLLTSLIERSDMPSNIWGMLRDQTLATAEKDATGDAEMRERLRASIETFFRDVARDAGLPAD